MPDLRIDTDNPDVLIFDNAEDGEDDDYYHSWLRFSLLDGRGVEVAESDAGGSIYLSFAQAEIVARRILEWCGKGGE